MPMFRPRTLAAALALLSCIAHAAPATVTTGNVDISYDRDTFAFNRDLGFGPESIDPASVGLSFAGNSVTLDFAGALSVYASGYGFSSTNAFGQYLANFSFAAQADYLITGYTVRYMGSYTIETPGGVNVGGSGIFLSESTGAASFDLSSDIGWPYLTGVLAASGYVDTIEVITGYDEVIVGYQDVEVCDDYGCTIEQRPIIAEVPIIDYQTDLGEASLSIDTITVTANVVAVPEPETYALLLTGLGVLAWAVRRRA